MREASITTVWAQTNSHPHPLIYITLPAMAILLALDQLLKWQLPEMLPTVRVYMNASQFTLTERFHTASVLSPPNLLRIAALSIALVVGVCLLRKLWPSPRSYFALGLLMGGLTSSLFDHLRYGLSSEWINLRWWPALDLADVAVFIGGLLLLGHFASSYRKARRSTL